VAGHGDGDYIAGPSGRIYLEAEGDGPVVLLVGGGPGVSHVHYHPWFSRLADQHTVVYYDHPGTGRSGPRTGAAYTLETYAAAIEAIRVHFDAATCKSCAAAAFLHWPTNTNRSSVR
jgi:proline iminopeptidase